jgi:hypothetical protein
MTAAIAAPVPAIRPAPLDCLPGTSDDDPFLSDRAIQHPYNGKSVQLQAFAALLTLQADNEVFSPAIRNLLKGVVEATGQSCGQPSATSIEVPRLGLRQAALTTSLA